MSDELQERGLGGGLHDGVLAGLPDPRAVLAVALDNAVARALYRGRGWREILPRFDYPLDHITEPYAVLGLDLPVSVTSGA